MSHSLTTKRVAFRPALGETRLEQRIAPAHVSPIAVAHLAARVTPTYHLPGQNTGSLTSPQLRGTPGYHLPGQNTGSLTSPQLRATPGYQLPGQNTGSLTSPQLRVLATPGAYHLPGQNTGSLTTPQLRGFFRR